MTQPQKLLEIDALMIEVSDGQRWSPVVSDVSLAIRRGETYCLVGESGSGKTVTALSVLSLLSTENFRCPSGSITLYGNDGTPLSLFGATAATLARVRGSRIGMIFQEPMTSLNPVLSIGEQLDEVLQIHRPQLGAGQRYHRIITLLEEVRIPDAASRLRDYPHRLSGGQRQRVMIAMALLCEPALLIADEPSTALDVTVQADILDMIRSLQVRYGLGVLFITHDFGVVSHIADTVGVMRHGKLVESGSVAQILDNPQHDYTRSLIAALPERLPRPPRPPMPERENATAPLIEVRDLKVHFPVRRGILRRAAAPFRAVDGVSLSIRSGEIVALVGESGCGKTTLGRALLRLIDPTGGDIRLKGQDITHLPQHQLRPLRRHMQVVFQDPGSSLNPRLPIVTTLLEPMRVHRIGSNEDERRQRASELLERVEMPADSLWRYPHEFSGGQRQRLAIARALVLQPHFILCDEITSALDVSVQAGILRLLRRLVDEDRIGMLFITHNMGVVEYLADRMAVMHQGRLVEAGPVDVVMHHPQQDYTQKLLAAVPRLK